MAIGGKSVGAFALVSAIAVANPAHAQRVEQNAAAQSDDAFGRTVGNERSGLYNAEDVRGFNPGEAGNNRLAGLYIDFQGILSARLIEGNTVRVGLAAQRFPFPAPSGLIDYDLKVPGAEREITIEIDNAGNIARGPAAQIEVKLPLAGERFGIAAGASFRNATRPEGGKHKFRTWSFLAAFRPAAGTEIKLFSSSTLTLGLEARPAYFPASSEPPPQFERGRFVGLDWTESDMIGHAHGALAKVALGSGWRIHAGLFLTDRKQEGVYADLLTGVTAARTASRLVIADPGVDDSFLSGEFRLIREWQSGPFSHSLTASLRGRRKNRMFGGSVRLDLGRGIIDDPATWPGRPAFTLGARNSDRVRQLAAGVSYNLLWQGRASLDIGLSKVHYTKRIGFADAALGDQLIRDRPLLWNVAASVSLTRNLIVFGGMTRGQEDALIAPDIAVNRAEAPPAIRTRQAEAGLRLALTPKLSLVASAFSISRPYYNLDRGLSYRNLGKLTNRGLEFSLTGDVVPGLRIVGGLLLTDPKIAGEAVSSGQIGERPVGQVRRRAVGTIEWRNGQGSGPLSIDLYGEAVSARVGNAANTLYAPPRSQINLGARYRFDLAGARMILRPQVLNLFNTYGWQVSPSGGFSYSTSRLWSVSLTADW